MYTDQNFRSRKALKDAIAAGARVTVQPNTLGRNAPDNGEVSLEGPHYPEPHKWYARATLRDGVVVKVH